MVLNAAFAPPFLVSASRFGRRQAPAVAPSNRTLDGAGLAPLLRQNGGRTVPKQPDMPELSHLPPDDRERGNVAARHPAPTQR
jgi:hypothetical protein